MNEGGGHGVLLAIMEPYSELEDEFNDWYDLEHIAHMSSVPGVLQATRWVCVEGWPRYLAVYDLETLDALHSQEYRETTGGHFTPWTRRILGRVRGWRRLALAGSVAALTDPAAEALELLHVESAAAAGGLAEWAAEEPGVIQARSFASRDGAHATVVVEAGALADLPRRDGGGERPALRGSARYVRYRRTDPLTAFRAIDAGERD